MGHRDAATASHEKKICQPTRKCVGPRCGDYEILSAVQAVSPNRITKEENFVSSTALLFRRFPYYMNTYGFTRFKAAPPAVATLQGP